MTLNQLKDSLHTILLCCKHIAIRRTYLEEIAPGSLRLLVRDKDNQMWRIDVAKADASSEQEWSKPDEDEVP
jgi:hypothetical protein